MYDDYFYIFLCIILAFTISYIYNYFDNKKLQNDSMDLIQESFSRELDRVHERLTYMSQDYVRSSDKISCDAALLQKQNQDIFQTITKLNQNFINPIAKGVWGEIQIKNILEQTGLLPYVDFVSQTSHVVLDDHSLLSKKILRPDIIIRLPGKKNIIIDVKSAIFEASEDQSIGQKVFGHIRGLNIKQYQSFIKDSLDFVIMFLPHDSLLSQSLHEMPNLLEEAHKKNIILTTPATLIGLLRVIAYVWGQQNIADGLSDILKSVENISSDCQKIIDNHETIQKKTQELTILYQKNILLLKKQQNVFSALKKVDII